ncbi:MAG: TonB-dependent receptor [Chitinophagaceae bacterium]|nr:TonB-dependent receptor [Chitinophagaceae bacterium]
MKKLLLGLLFVLLFTSLSAQETYTLSGRIFDSTNQKGLISASVRIKGTGSGAVTNDNGDFLLKTIHKIPLTLLVSSVGYKTQEFFVSRNTSSLSIALNAETVLVDQLVVTASRKAESILRSPVTIEKLDIKSIRESPSPTFYDALENVKGVQMLTLSMGYKVPNTRGFTGTTNSRFLQMVDGIDNISPGIGAPVGNAFGPTELDIESVELIPGAASALYGLNAVNGIANLKTKSPFKFEGLSVYQKLGVNHVDNRDHAAALYTESAIRYAKVIGKKFAFKLNAAYSHGTDWVASNTHDQYFDAGNKTNLSLAANNPAADLINRYGDEYNSDLRTLTLNGKKYDVSRTGYLEKDLTDYTVKNAKFDAGVFYKITPNTELSYSYRFGSVSNYDQRGNRIRLDGEKVQQHKIELTGKYLQLRGYYTRENTGDSYNFRPLGENIDLAFKKPTQWYNDYTTAFNTAINTGNTVEGAHAAARTAADNGRFIPGTAAFDSVLNKITHTNNWDTVGAALILKSGFVHLEGQYDWSGLIHGIQILTGFNYRNYVISPDGNNYVNPDAYANPKLSATDFHYYSYGGFVQATKSLFADKLKATVSFRVDKSEYFEPKINPRIAFVYSPTQRHNFRISFQNGYRFPTLFEGFAYVNNGGVRRLGGLKVTSEHLGVFENSYINTSVTAFKNAVNNDVNNGMNQNTAIQKETSLLVKTNYTYLQPEHINSFEIGYKGYWLNHKLFIDVDYYFSAYDHFIGQLDVTQPYKGVIGTTGGVNDSTAFYTYNGGKQVNKYKMWTNSTSAVTNQGVEAGVNYNFYKGYSIGANASYAALANISAADAFIPAFNTPSWITNLTFSNSEVARNTGFNLVWHWQNSFDWASPLATGKVPAYGTLDAQVNHRFTKVNTTVKFGATNILNKRYYQYLGGPVIGGFYYFTVTFDANRKT